MFYIFYKILYLFVCFDSARHSYNNNILHIYLLKYQNTPFETKFNPRFLRRYIDYVNVQNKNMLT